MNIKDVMHELKSYGSEQTKKIYINHGAREPVFGVKVQDLKKIVKKVKKNHQLSLELFATQNVDAMYLAGLIADEKKITKNDLQNWAKQANYYWISEYTVPWVAAESDFGWELALEWIDSGKENIASAGWSTLSSFAGLLKNNAIDIDKYSALLDRVEKDIHTSENRVRYTMNNFVIAVGGYLPELTEKAMNVAARIGKVHVDQGGTACKVPLAGDYIQKIIDKGYLGKKRKTARC